MLLLTRSNGARVYIGASCVVEVVRFSNESVRLRVWADGHEREHVVPLHGRLPLPAGASVTFIRQPEPGSHNVKLGFVAPRGVPIKRAELLTLEEREPIRAAAGVPNAV